MFNPRNIRKGFIAASFAIILLMTVANPIAQMIGASTLAGLSLLEFYMIGITLKPAPSKKGPGFFKHIYNDLWGSLKIALQIASLVSFIPFVMTLSGLIALPSLSLLASTYHLYDAGKMLLALYSISGFISMDAITGKSYYEYVSLKTMILSVSFAMITNLAASLILSNVAFAAVLYACSIIPLLYFIPMVYSGYNSSAKDHPSFWVGALSVGVHLLEAACIVGAIVTQAPVLVAASHFLSSYMFQVPLLGATTAAAGLKILAPEEPREFVTLDGDK